VTHHHHSWIEMPAAGSGAADDPVRAKYALRGGAFLIHQGGKVYVMCRDQLARTDALEHADCRELSSDESRAFEETLPFPLAPALFADRHHTRGAVGLGDLVSWLTRKLGIAECSGCQRRKRWLNRAVLR
jgi:hypothetical protein